MADRIRLISQLDQHVHNLKATKARSQFILNSEHLNLNIYRYEPAHYLELVEAENKVGEHAAEYEIWKDFKEREALRHHYELWHAQE